MSRVFAFLLALLAACAASAPSTTVPLTAPSRPVAPAASASAPELRQNLAAAPHFRCTEVIGLTITAEWYEAGFEQLVDDARFQARTRPHTFVDQWADPAHEAWSAPVSSPCAEQSSNPDRVVLFVANWQLASQEEWAAVLERAVGTLQRRYPALRDLELYTVLRGPKNQSCGDPKSVVDPMIDEAIAGIAMTHAGLVQAGPRLEASDCSVFDKGGPHFTAEGRRLVAKQLAEALR
jgi:hypothetical protein